jgi:hypothetical protein
MVKPACAYMEAHLDRAVGLDDWIVDDDDEEKLPICVATNRMAGRIIH